MSTNAPSCSPLRKVKNMLHHTKPHEQPWYFSKHCPLECTSDTSWAAWDTHIHFLGFFHLFFFISFFCSSSISKILCMFKWIATIPSTLVTTSQQLHFYYFSLWLKQYSYSNYICKSSELSLQTAATCWLLLSSLPSPALLPSRSLFEMSFVLVE